MNNLTKVFLLSTVLFLSSCARGCEGFKRSVQMSSKNYHITQYGNNGTILNEYRFKGIVNNSANSDGVYFSIGDSTVELSGTLKIVYE